VRPSVFLLHLLFCYHYATSASTGAKAMEEKQQLTTEERRKQKIAQLKAQLQKEESRLNKDKRKERDG
jgi:tRNA A37 methylthiotransferase MiaB